MHENTWNESLEISSNDHYYMRIILCDPVVIEWTIFMQYFIGNMQFSAVSIFLNATKSKTEMY